MTPKTIDHTQLFASRGEHPGLKAVLGLTATCNCGMISQEAFSAIAIASRLPHGEALRDSCAKGEHDQPTERGFHGGEALLVGVRLTLVREGVEALVGGLICMH